MKLGKRSEFERVERDYYRTFDLKAGATLKPFIEEYATYFEPFAGAGDLVNQIDFADCVYKTDIEPQSGDIDTFDAFDYNKSMLEWRQVDYLISNPPWSREIFHRALDHFVPMIDVWFLMSSNWKHNKSSAPYVSKWLVDIVPVGRMKWIENSPHSGKDDCDWLKFSRNKNEPARFHPRG